MTRRLPWPGLYGDPLGPRPSPAPDAHARRYLEWWCAREGIDLPKGWDGDAPVGQAPSSHAVYTWTDFYFDRGQAYAVVHHRSGHLTRPSNRHVWRTEWVDEKLLRVDLPPWALPCKRPDLWHASHQAGMSPDDCHGEGEGWGERHRRYLAKHPHLYAAQPEPTECTT